MTPRQLDESSFRFRSTGINISPAICFIFLSAFGAVGFIGAFLLGKLPGSEVQLAIAGILTEVFKAIFIGSSVGVILNKVLKAMLSEKEADPLGNTAIHRIYANRQSTASDLLDVVRNPATKEVCIVGISLHEFLLGGGPLRDAWHAIESRLRSEHEAQVVPTNRLHLRLLMLDPTSSEGVFRHQVEADSIGRAGITSDVPHGLEAIKGCVRDIYSAEKSEFLEVRLYKHCPFCYLFLTNRQVYLEQYHYRDHRNKTTMPVVNYVAGSPQYDQMRYSFDIIWKNTAKTEWVDHEVGTARGVREAKMRNVFRRGDRNLLGRSALEAVKTSSGDFIGILAITGKHYRSHPMFETLREKSKQMPVKILLLHPVSEQAIYRAIADSNSPEKMHNAVVGWNWSKHTQTNLFQDVVAAIRECKDWQEQEQGLQLEIRLYACAPTASMLLTGKRIFTEPYFYGRSNQYRDGKVLGGEFPVFEFEVDKDDLTHIEWQVLRSTFDLIWKHYSVPADSFTSDDSSCKAEFEAKLISVKEILSKCGAHPHRVDVANFGQTSEKASNTAEPKPETGI